ncbi:hypothetical protein LZG04_14275 [Saccharothrix sp. S26]|uniref:hypothetical protein n=1 Tax=Saccharothrix sp. S26 TaxID=2907215 RepID=UPI001F40E574|nr:hypothetical protein [Saccharothrix sp. S26]MCE6995960.1 hypothetical protein [Saccharothrix sp. S26]
MSLPPANTCSIMDGSPFDRPGGRSRPPAGREADHLAVPVALRRPAERGLTTASGGQE